jgi:DivIVA domain-containing protein
VPLTPDEIEAKEFVVALRGYDPGEVSAFLREVAADYRELERQVKGLGRGSAALPHPVEGLMERLSAVLRTATDEASEILAAAEREAAQIRDAAKKEAGIPTGGDDGTDVLSRARATVRQAVDRYRH